MVNIAGPPAIKRQQAAAREQRAVELRLLGATYDEIAASRLPCTEHKPAGDPDCERCLPLYAERGSARRAVVRALARDYALGAEGREQLRQRHLARLDLLYRKAARAAVGGNWEALRGVLRLMDQQAKILGIYAPVRVQQTDELDAEIAALLDKLGVPDPAAEQEAQR